MESVHTPFIHTIRKFNRFYTNILGLLDQHMLNSDFSLSEARVLYDIAHNKDCTAKQLIQELSIDSGYLSRIIKRFEKQGLTYRVQSKEDGRLFYLYLTELGKETLDKLNGLSDKHITSMVSELQEAEQERLVKSMENIQEILSGDQNAIVEEDINLRCELRPGDVGRLIELHGWLYEKECGYNHIFEGYVCKTFYDFLLSYNPEKDRIWLAEAQGKIVGAIAIVGHSEELAQLRWFIIHPSYRSIGLGRRLLTQALQFCRDKNYKRVFLDTTREQKTAVSMYKKAGFQLVKEFENNFWGKALIEQNYELKL